MYIIKNIKELKYGTLKCKRQIEISLKVSGSFFGYRKFDLVWICTNVVQIRTNVVQCGSNVVRICTNMVQIHTTLGSKKIFFVNNFFVYEDRNKIISQLISHKYPWILGRGLGVKFHTNLVRICTTLVRICTTLVQIRTNWYKFVPNLVAYTVQWSCLWSCLCLESSKDWVASWVTDRFNI